MTDPDWWQSIHVCGGLDDSFGEPGWGRATHGAPGFGPPYLGARCGFAHIFEKIPVQPLTGL